MGSEKRPAPKVGDVWKSLHRKVRIVRVFTARSGETRVEYQGTTHATSTAYAHVFVRSRTLVERDGKAVP